MKVKTALILGGFSLVALVGAGAGILDQHNLSPKEIEQYAQKQLNDPSTIIRTQPNQKTTGYTLKSKKQGFEYTILVNSDAFIPKIVSTNHDQAKRLASINTIYDKNIIPKLKTFNFSNTKTPILTGVDNKNQPATQITLQTSTPITIYDLNVKGNKGYEEMYQAISLISKELDKYNPYLVIQDPKTNKPLYTFTNLSSFKSPDDVMNVIKQVAQSQLAEAKAKEKLQEKVKEVKQKENGK